MRRTSVEPETNPLGPKKTFLIIATVVGCIGILWPKVFHPMLAGGQAGHSHIDPMLPPILRDRAPGCCGVVLNSEFYMNNTLGGGDTKRYRDSLEMQHLVKDQSIRQERPLHMRPDAATHPAMRERGNQFPSGPTHTRTVIDGRPGPIPGMRPPMGGGAFQQAPPKGNSMGLIMPLYTLGIITFFVYTIMKIMVKKPPGQDRKTSIVTNGQPAKEKLPEKQEEQEEQLVIKRPQNGSSSKLVVTAIQGLIDAADEQLKKRTVDDKDQDPKKPEQEDRKTTKEEDKEEQTDDQNTVKVLGMEQTSTYEGGKKWDPSNPKVPANKARELEELIETVTPQEIYLEGTLPHDSKILVSDSEEHLEEGEPSAEDGEGPAIILSSKMTLSLISLDHEDRTSSQGKANGSSGQVSEGSANHLGETIGRQ